MQTEYKVYYAIAALIDVYGRVGVTSDGVLADLLHSVTVETFIGAEEDPFVEISSELYRKFGISDKTNIIKKMEEKTIRFGVLKKVILYLYRMKNNTTLKLEQHTKNTIEFLTIDEIDRRVSLKNMSLSYCSVRMLEFLRSQPVELVMCKDVKV